MGYTNESSLSSAVEIWANIKKFVHPNYVKDTHQNDIALLKLDVPLNLSGNFTLIIYINKCSIFLSPAANIYTINMAVSSDINKTYVGENVVSTGFGKTWKGITSSKIFMKIKKKIDCTLLSESSKWRV